MKTRDVQPVLLSICVVGGALVLVGCSSDAVGGDPSSSAPPSASSAHAPSPDGSASMSGEPSGDEPRTPTGSESSGGDAPAATGSPISDAGGSSSVSDPGLPPMPAAAEDNSEEGAEVFARWYVETWSHLYQHPEAGIFGAHAADSCKTCSHWEGIFADSVESGEHALDKPVTVTGSSALPLADGGFQVGVDFEHHDVTVADRSGKVVETISSPEVTGFVVTLQRHGDDWIVTEMPARVAGQDDD